MALADYYARNALAAAQVLAGFDEQRIREVLDKERVGLCIGTDAAQSSEGRSLIDLLVRLFARLYPTLVVRGETWAQGAAQDTKDLARRINPAIDFASDPTIEIAVGAGVPDPGKCPRIFVGSSDWNAFVGTAEPRPVGRSANPFGAGAAACLAAANLFRWIFLRDESHLDKDVTFSVLEAESRRTEDAPITGSLGEIVLVGAGAIGNAAAWALSRVPMEGLLHIVDHQTIDLGNLQRYVLAERGDESGMKVEVLARYFKGKVQAKPHAVEFDNFVASEGYTWPRVMLALDSASDRRAAQSSLPQWIANAWTQPGDLGVSSHDFLHGACVACLYLPEHALENEDAIIAAAFGVPNQLMQIRTLLYSGQGVPRELLDLISSARNIPIERLQPFEGRAIRRLYTEGFCGGAVIPFAELGTPRQEVHVPLAHQSALSGLLLAAAAVRQALGLNGLGTQITRIDVMRMLGLHLTQPAGKDKRGICICQDADYCEVYKSKYAKF
jgi:hypothetical protein